MFFHLELKVLSSVCDFTPYLVVTLTLSTRFVIYVEVKGFSKLVVYGEDDLDFQVFPMTAPFS